MNIFNRLLLVISLVSAILFVPSGTAFGQCQNATAYGSSAAPTENIEVQISSNLWRGYEYNTLTGVTSGRTYLSDMSRSGYITVRSGSPGGPVVAYGAAPLSWTAVASGTHYIHYSSNSNCGQSDRNTRTTIRCTSCPTSQRDCEGAQLVCNSSTINANSNGAGVQEISGANSGCDMVDENQSTWFYVYIQSGGTLEMTISPEDPSDDYDWAIWGPYNAATAAANCSPTEAPLRCNTSANAPLTGMNPSATSDYEFPGYSTNRWSNPIQANSGDVYILLIDNWSNSGRPYQLNWSGTCALGCTAIELPVELISFQGESFPNENILTWKTASEKDNAYFVLETSADGSVWTEIDRIPGAGTTSTKQTYTSTHRVQTTTVQYYRLFQYDYDGSEDFLGIVSLNNQEEAKTITKRVNLFGQEVNETYRGMVIEYYSDGSIQKKVQ